MKKSASKRIKLTKNGKVVRRPTGVNHFKTRKSSKGVQLKRKKVGLSTSVRAIKNY